MSHVLYLSCTWSQAARLAYDGMNDYLPRADFKSYQLDFKLRDFA
jgi:hypothetical protein